MEKKSQYQRLLFVIIEARNSCSIAEKMNLHNKIVVPEELIYQFDAIAT